MNKSLLLFALGQAMSLGQNVPPGLPAPETTKLIHVHNAIPGKIAELMGSAGFQVGADNMMGVIVVRGGPERIASAEHMIRELDQPRETKILPDVETTTYIITASDKALPQTTTPVAMEPVIKQLKAIFPYANYQVIDTVLVRSRQGVNATAQGRMLNTTAQNNEKSIEYQVRYTTNSGSTLAGKRDIHFDDFGFQAGPARLNSSFDIREEQKVVVGKTNINDGESALFVVLTARILE